MNWNRAKTILIIMFFLTAIFQSSVLFTSEKKAKHISPEIITSAAELLNKNQIKIDTAIIPDVNYSLPAADADNAINDYKTFSELILGDNISKISDTEFSSDSGTVTFSHNNFEFTSKNKGSSPDSNQASAERKMNNFLRSLGFDLGNMTKETRKISSGYEFVCTNCISKVPVFNSKVTVLVENGEVSKAYGKWFNVTSKSRSVKLKSITGVLVDIMKADIEKPAEITDISVGYTIPENNSFQKSASLIPAWQITLNNGETISVDARNPQ